MIGRVRYWKRTRWNSPRRYRALLRTIHARACRRLVEVGVYHGDRAVQMIQTAALRHPASQISYWGFDLFEDLTADRLAREFSKRPGRLEAVRRKLDRTGAAVCLVRGDSRVTLPAAAAGLDDVDLIFIDGGHSIDTIAADWHNMQPAIGERTIVFLDDYYVDPAPELAGAGCQTLIASLDRRRYSVEVLPATDEFAKPWGVLRIRMVAVRRAGG